MHRPQSVTWTTHTTETTTLQDYRKLYTYMCNIVREFYLYSIVYIYLINSRLDVTFSVHHHFRMKLYHGVRLVVRFSLRILQRSELTAFQEAYQEDFKYSDFFRDHKLWPQHIGDVRREFICCGLDSGLEKAI